MSLNAGPTSYFYDSQIRRFLLTIVRAFSGFQYSNGSGQLIGVPARHALTNSLVGNLMQNGSTNTLASVPMISIYQTGINFSKERLQNVAHVDTRTVTERKIDPATNTYTGDRGRSYTVKRLMPIPFDIKINVDIWTSNLDQKYQLLEQILLIFAPDISIQNSDNALDWSAMTRMELENVNFTSRSIPIGDSNSIDIMTFEFVLPMWISPPAKVEQQHRIEEVITNIFQGERGFEEIDQGVKIIQTITTPNDYKLSVSDAKLTLLLSQESDNPARDWNTLLHLYGAQMFGPNSSVSLKTTTDLDDHTHDIVGTIQIDINDPTQAFWQIDPTTLPANTLDPISAIVDPHRSWPGNRLPNQAPGQRYLIVSDIGGANQTWTGLNAKEYDIIQYTNGQWTTVFRPVQGNTTDRVYVTNKHTGVQLTWDGTQFVKAIDGIYPPGMWRIKI